ncbi:hypothetical protein PDM24_11615 [Bacteroides fragilis]|uniref:hypothetical protein n=1 Tax=Bacteroides fragilis TaxID=817 RepID=UPI0022DF66FA|nr:hypothetical protein [Bacteroides fragilis]MCS2422555.1 hypothetical protein [Bacteroides fragilis]MDA1471538.1 hypothetical protein [Bacteroides fragilis]MDA1480688.1 hypothetical protein [Bacteroides fragilis]
MKNLEVLPLPTDINQKCFTDEKKEEAGQAKQADPQMMSFSFRKWFDENLIKI